MTKQVFQFLPIICLSIKFNDHPFVISTLFFFFYKNIFYKNIEAEICEILRIF